MYKLLLSWRYLRTRYIALASIISVTLGVGTLIVVNGVMAGFTREMHVRLHGILSDIIVESHSDVPPVPEDPTAVPADPTASSSTASSDFDRAKEQFTGIVLGIAIGSVRQRNPEGKVLDYFLCRPGDDVQVTFPSAGTPPKA